MRLWSFHPRYLDPCGSWRCYAEGMGGIRALLGQQRMHAQHPQLERWRALNNPENAIAWYLEHVSIAALANGSTWPTEHLEHLDYQEDEEPAITVTHGQLVWEWQHYRRKLETQRGRDRYLAGLPIVYGVEPHPMMRVVEGPVEPWETTAGERWRKRHGMPPNRENAIVENAIVGGHT